MGAIEDLAKKFATFCGRQASLPVVSLEEFFEGNDVRYSMGANLSDDDCLTPPDLAWRQEWNRPV